MSVLIECKQLSKIYREKPVIQDLSFSIKKGEKVMLLGANGAGKTTTLRLILGLESPTSGTVKLNNYNPKNPTARVNIGITPQESDFIDELTVLETIDFVKAHYQDSFSNAELIKIFILDEFINKKTIELSLGQKRRLALALAFINRPTLIFLDEPTVGLDVESRHKIWAFIKKYTYNPAVTLLLTTHYLEEAETLTERVLYIQKGHLLSDSSIGKFKDNFSQVKIKFQCDSFFENQELNKSIDKIECQGNQYTLLCNDSDSVIRQLVKLNVPFYQLKIYQSTLEDAYLQYEKDIVLC